jgi:hypothetical protein
MNYTNGEEIGKSARAFCHWAGFLQITGSRGSKVEGCDSGAGDTPSVHPCPRSAQGQAGRAVLDP